MLVQLISMMKNNELQVPLDEIIDVDDYVKAIKNTLNIWGLVGMKYVFIFELY